MDSVRNNCPRLTQIKMPKQFSYYISITDIVYNMVYNPIRKTIFDYLAENIIYEREQNVL